MIFAIHSIYKEIIVNLVNDAIETGFENLDIIFLPLFILLFGINNPLSVATQSTFGRQAYDYGPKMHNFVDIFFR